MYTMLINGSEKRNRPLLKFWMSSPCVVEKRNILNRDFSKKISEKTQFVLDMYAPCNSLLFLYETLDILIPTHLPAQISLNVDFNGVLYPVYKKNYILWV